MNSDTLIVGCVAGATTLTYVSRITRKKPVTVQPLLGGFIAGAMLFALGMASDDVAKAFAILMLVSSALINGTTVFDAFGRIAGE